MTDYELVAMAGLGLVYVASSIYLDRKRKVIINDFKNWTNNYFIPKSKEVQIQLNNFKNKLEKIAKK